MEDKKLLQLVSDIGFDMLSYGGEIYRVEETVKRICFAYGIEIVDVFAIPSTIIVSITRQEETYSRTRRIISKGTDLDKVDQLNNLSRQLCREKPDYISAKEMLRQIRTGIEYPLWMLCGAHGAAALIFALFFGGNWKDGMWAFPIGIMIKLVSYGFTEGFYYKPRVDKELLRKYSKGIIASSACLAGEVPRNILNVSYEKAKEVALEYLDIFGEGNYFLELQDHGIREQKIVNEALVRMSRETGIPLICTNDSHYIYKEDAEPHALYQRRGCDST